MAQPTMGREEGRGSLGLRPALKGPQHLLMGLQTLQPDSGHIGFGVPCSHPKGVAVGAGCVGLEVRRSVLRHPAGSNGFVQMVPKVMGLGQTTRHKGAGERRSPRSEPLGSSP